MKMTLSLVLAAAVTTRVSRDLTRVLAAILVLLHATQGLSTDRLPDTETKEEWVGYGNSDDQNHFSPLSDIDSSNVSQLGLVWWQDVVGTQLHQSLPIQVGGRIYFSTGYDVLKAVDAATGNLLWTYDPKSPREYPGAGVRGISFWKDKVC